MVESSQYVGVPSVGLETSSPEEPFVNWRYVVDVSLLGDTCTVIVERPKKHKCVRCWAYTSKKEGGVCRRCSDTLAGWPDEKLEPLFNPQLVTPVT